MKNVIFENSPNSVEAKTLNDSSIIGFEDNIGRRGFVTRKSFSSGHYIAMSAEAVHRGSHYGSFDSFKALLDNLRVSMSRVLLFGTEKELFLWLSHGR